MSQKSLKARVLTLEITIEMAIRALENRQHKDCLKLLKAVLEKDER